MPSLPTQPAHSPTGLPKRAALGVVVLLVLTVGTLGAVWYWPERTLLHFLWAAQAVPVLYVVLAWWGMRPQTEASDHG